MSFMDKTFCASPNCKNDCGRKMTDKERILLDKQPDYITVSYASFCDKPDLTEEVLKGENDDKE